jgi:DNA-binding GntR family transcriptional regulator
MAMDVQTVTVADAVADELRRRLLSGHYQGGEQLRDTDLSQEFGVARPTIRAAVQRLVADGLLERGRGRSAAVRSFAAEDAIDLNRLRRPIEVAAVEMIMSQGRPIDGVDAALRRFAALSNDVPWDVVADHDVAFHRAVFVAAGSVRLLRTFDELGAELRLLIAQLRPTYGSVRDLAHEHELLLAALRSGDLQRARVAWDKHCNDSERFFLNLIQERAQ